MRYGSTPQSTSMAAAWKKGKKMRFTVNPGQLPTTMGVLRRVLTRPNVSTIVCFDTSRVRTISTRGITCAGLHMPHTHRSDAR
jgi:hypothetical protein